MSRVLLPEREVNQVYNRLLSEVKKVISQDSAPGTTQSELNKAGRDAFGVVWGGCISLDQWEDIQSNRRQFYIMNTLPSDSATNVGHWLAVYDGKVWDSFHRCLQRLIPSIRTARPFTELNNLGIDNQPDSATDCGERCIAALELFKTLYE